ncbi:hypothetical protein I656_04189 [Geobacillus sp. WSUCF1]|nr:hypothetical protein I656_04189 [Geobacillus sp. WSUCF1]
MVFGGSDLQPSRLKVIDRIFEMWYSENSARSKCLMQQAFLGFLSYL